ncbi:MAG: hypothetical protein L6Q92_06260 [Phycisphaerae bacterium]|nr:hypothetical protein [Phycisphaerae bacterium]
MRQAIIPLLLVGLSGCQSPRLDVSDTYAMPGRVSVLEAHVEQRAVLGDDRGVPGARVVFRVDDRTIGEAVTDGEGLARLTCALQEGEGHIHAETTVAGKSLRAEGGVYAWPKDRTIIVCDIDETVSDTHIRELLTGRDEDTRSQPLRGSVETLKTLASRYGLLYLTARPGSLMAKTRTWLERHGFPSAPLITTPSIGGSLAPRRFKDRKLMELRRNWPNLLIGIGNANSDSEAYAKNGLLALIIDDEDDNRFRSHAVVLRDWRMVRAFFDANEAVLAEPTKLADVLASEGMLLRPVIRYQKD